MKRMASIRFTAALATMAALAGPALAQPDVATSNRSDSAGTSPDSNDDVDRDAVDPDDSMMAGDQSDRPWAKDVPAAEQAAAIRLFKEGNALLKDSIFTDAAVKYRQALTHWDHPGIHFNLALALLKLDRPLAVYESLDKAMRYGPAALDIEKLDQAQRYKDLVGKQIATLTIECKDPGARVSLNGQPLLTCPNSWTKKVRVGEHSVVATKEGYIATSETRQLEGGSTEVISIDNLYTADELTRYSRRWKPWKPWTLAVSGLAVGAVGGLLHLQSRADFREFDDFVASDECTIEGEDGCIPPDDIASLRDRGNVL
ncbi:MAG: PEGA domain-containing protein, partial [Myxococcota bacterium]